MIASWLSVLIPAGLALLYGTYKYILDRRYRNLPPGPRPVPFLGSLLALGKKSKHMHVAFRKLAEEYGNVFTFYLGCHFRVIVINDAKTINDVFVGQGKTFSGRYEKAMLPVMKYVSEGIIMESGETWRKHRRFGMKAMHDFGMGREIMVEKINDEVAYLVSEFDKVAASGKTFFPRRHFANAVSNVVCALVFGKRYDDPHDPQFARLVQLLDSLLSTPRNSIARIISVIFPFSGHILKDRSMRTYLELVRLIEGIVTKSIKDHRLDFDSENIRDFPDLFIQAEKQDEAITARNFAAVVTELFSAGTETTSTALTWTILYLTKQPDIQKKCHEAIDSVIESDRLPTIADRQKLPYIDAVFHETLRFASITPLGAFHSNLENGTKIGNFDCPAYSIAVYNAAAVHYDPTYWNEPEKFNPDRWIGKDGKLLSHSTHFMPFGLGPRVCLGESLARMEYFLFFVAIMQRFEFRLTTPEVTYDDGNVGSIHSSPQYQVLIKRRH